jgi:glycosyltransferase involved in cell wall biosynthesis
MLSICIPVYNFDIRPLVGSLHQQAQKLDAGVEILVIDDASPGNEARLNREIVPLYGARYQELEKNAGRSRIRNMLAREASYDWIIFMDCDSMPPDELFLERYLAATAREALVCGGRSYRPQPPGPEFSLHWCYGTNREVKPAGRRSQNPYNSFMSCNFMVHRSVVERVIFNELITGYGHEDTLFGYELKKNKIPLLHIDNPLLHIGLQNNQEFLDKTAEGIANLWKIHNLLGKPADFSDMVRVLKTFSRLESLKLQGMFYSFTRAFIPGFLKNLQGAAPRLAYLDIYKLHLLCRQQLQTRKNNE